jgi:Bacterial mobilisation protein (MobC)
MDKSKNKIITRKRNKHIDLKLTESEFMEIKKKADEAKLSKQEFLYRAAFGKEIIVIENGVEIVRELIRIGTNINQIAKIANSSGEIDRKGIERLSVEVGMIWQQLNLCRSKKVGTSNN